MEKKLLPPDQRKIAVEVGPDGRLVLMACFHEKAGTRFWTPLRFSYFSQTLTCIDDLERLIVEHVDMLPVDGNSKGMMLSKEQAIELLRSKFTHCTPGESLRRALECRPSDFNERENCVAFRIPGTENDSSVLYFPLDYETYEILRPWIQSAISPDSTIFA